MNNHNKKLILLVSIILWLSTPKILMAQDTQIKGFAHTDVTLQDDKVSFGFGEWDLFITSELSQRFSFLGETVFKYALQSPTHFSVGVERLIISYNYKGNNSFLIGKHHTPINYWNVTYHHGRVFFPTIGRPILFAAKIIPIHTTGVALQGDNLGAIRFGYNFMIGNGLGSGDILDNDNYKSVTAAVHIKPKDQLQIGLSYYNDVISEDVEIGGNPLGEKVKQNMVTASLSHFGKNFEVLTEASWISNNGDSTGVANNFAAYFYAGWRIKEKFIPYFRYDNLTFGDAELIYIRDNTNSYIGGFRYEINYLIVVKFEYQHFDREIAGFSDRLSAQIAIGF